MPAPVATYRDSGLTPATTYTYALFSYNSTGSLSAPATTTAVTTCTLTVQHVSGTVTSDTSWSPACTTAYVIDSSLTVPQGVTLTLAPGTVVKASGGAGTIFGTTYSISVQGTLNAVGTAATPITFTSINDNTLGGATGSGTPLAGDWSGIWVQSAGSVDMEHDTVRYATDAVYGATSGSVVVSNSTFAGMNPDKRGGGSVGWGVPHAIGVQAGSATVTNNTIMAAPAAVSVDAPSVTVMGNTATSLTGQVPAYVLNSTALDFSRIGGNAASGGVGILQVSGSAATSTYSDPMPLLLYGPFQSSVVTGNTGGSFTVPPAATLTLAPGTTVKASGGVTTVYGTTYSMAVQGTLDAVGTEAAPITFTSSNDNTVGGLTGNGTPLAGDWSGIWVQSGNVDMEHVAMRYATGALYGATTGSIVVSNSTFGNLNPDHHDSGTVGWGQPQAIAVQAGSATVTNNTISAAPAAVSVDSTNLTVSGNTATALTGQVPAYVLNSSALDFTRIGGNTSSGGVGLVQVSGSAATSTYSDGMPLFVYASRQSSVISGNTGGALTVPQGVTLTLAPGTVVKAIGAAPSAITVVGTFNAVGTSAAPITFTSSNDNAVGGPTGSGTPLAGDWSGIWVQSGTVDLEQIVLRYAYNAVLAYPSNTTVHGTLEQDTFGIQGPNAAADGSCPSGIVEASGVNWGSPSGPAPFGTGPAVSGCVKVVPWVGYSEWQARNFGEGFAPGSTGTGSYTRARYGVGDPVDPVSGNFSIAVTDVSVPEPGPSLVFARAFDSQSLVNGPLGHGWSNTWMTSVDPTTSPIGTVDLHWGDGRIDAYNPQPDGSLTPAAGNFTTLTRTPAGFTAATKAHVTYAFDTSGALSSVTDENGNLLSVSSSAPGVVTAVHDQAGRTLAMSYSNGLLSTVTDPAGATWQFAYTRGDLTSVTDPTGAVNTYRYDDSDRLIAAVNGNRSTVTNTYDIQWRVTSQADNDGHTTTYGYDPANRRTTKTAPNGGVRSYTYNQLGQLVSDTDEMGDTTADSFDPAGDLISRTDPLGNVTTFAYDQRGNQTSSTDPLGRTSTVAYHDDLPASRTDPAGATTTWAYNANDNLISTTDPKGHTTAYTVNSRGLRTSTTDPLGRTTTYTYDTAGNVTSTTDPLGRTTTSTYDPDGRALSVTDPAGDTTTYSYDSRGERTATTDPLGKTTTVTYNPDGQEASSKDPLGRLTVWNYTSTGLVAAVIDPTGAVTFYVHDANGNVVSVTDPTGQVTTYIYDATNRHIQTTDPTGATTTITYDRDGRIIAVTDPLGRSTTSSYDAAGQSTTVTDPAGDTTRFAYDADGRLSTLTDANRHFWTNQYDANGNPTSSVDGLGRLTLRTFDAANQLTLITDPAGAATTYTYDAAGQRTTASYPGGTTASYTYDPAGRLVKRIDAAGTFTEAYDADGHPTQTTDGLGRTISYTYDNAGQLSSRAQPGATTTFGYDADGRITAADDAGGNATWTYDASGTPIGASLPNGVHLAVTADPDHRITALAYTQNTNTVFSEALTYDPAGQITGITDPTGAHTYTYDPAGRLAADTTAGGTTSWTYDPVGNRTSQTSNGIVTTTTYTYDAADQLTTSTTGSFHTTYSYNARGDLTTINAPNGTTTYTYDGQDHLTGISTPAGTWADTVDDNGTLLRQSGTSANTYLTDPTTGQLLAASGLRVVSGAHPYATAGGPAAPNAIAIDTLGSGRAVISAAGVVATTNFTPWGQTVGTPPPASPVGFTGGIAQPDGTTRLGQRVLDPATGRWTSRDPTGLRESNGADTLYTYVADEPLNHTDPTGQSFWGDAWSKARTAKTIYGQVKTTYNFLTAEYDTLTGRAFGVTSAINRATGSRPTTASQDAGYHAYGPATRVNSAYNNDQSDLEQLDQLAPGLSCVARNEVVVNNGATRAAQQGEGLETGAIGGGRPSSSYVTSAISSLTSLVRTSNDLCTP